jgi:hypothetical protein
MKVSRNQLQLTDRDDWADDRRPPHQAERGQRYGNLRNQEAELKVRRRRIERAQNKRDMPRDFE